MDQNLDRKAILAIALCLILVFAYQPLMRALGMGHYFDRPHPAAVDTTRRTPMPAATNAPLLDSLEHRPAPDSTSLSNGAFSSAPGEIERTIEVETPLYFAHFSSRGARLVSVELKQYASAHGISSANGKIKVWHHNEVIPPGDRVTLAGGPLIGLDLGSGGSLQSLANLAFTTEESLDVRGAVRRVTFTHSDASGLKVRETWRVRPESYALDLETSIEHVPPSLRLSDYTVTLRSWPLVTEADLSSDARGLRASSLVGTNIHRDRAGGLARNPKRYDGNIQWAAVQNRYFLNGIAVVRATANYVTSTAERRDLSREELASLPPGSVPTQEIVTNRLVLGLPGETQPVNRFVVYLGPCEYFQLARLKQGLERAVDLGWSWLLPFSKALLWLLNRIYDVVRNYGFAIVALATLVRLALHPLNVSSMRSMRSMQRLQPEMDRIRQKYKNDPQAMNTSMMALYRENKVNPAGGCLPLVIQMPMFIALYNVLFNAIELRQAPFIFWMHDLSAPDLLFSVGTFPIRLLPVLMSGTGFLQQMVTPTAPEQKPTMYMMNAVMLVFFYNLPSGLVLYWTVMNLLTALQQWIVMRQDPGATVPMPMPVQAVAGSGSRKRSR